MQGNLDDRVASHEQSRTLWTQKRPKSLEQIVEIRVVLKLNVLAITSTSLLRDMSAIKEIIATSRMGWLPENDQKILKEHL